MENSTLSPNGSSTTIISPAEQLTLTVALAVIVFSGVIGNSVVVIIMLISKEHRKTSTNTFVLNLAIADLMFIVCCAPFQGSIYILEGWEFGRFICKSVHCLQYATMLASILILAFMAVERYAALTHPFHLKRFSTVFVANMISGLIWLIAFISSIPWIVLYDIHLVPMRGHSRMVCYDNWQSRHYMRKWYFFYFFLLGFLIPAIVISTMSGLTAATILKHSKDDVPENRRHEGSITRRVSQTRKRRRVTGIIFAVAILFLICWLPHNIAIMWINFGHFGYTKGTFVFRVLTHIFTYINSVLNPFLYALLSDNFKRILAKLLATHLPNGGEQQRRQRYVRKQPQKRNISSKDCARVGAGAIGGHHSASGQHSSNSILAALLRELSPITPTFELQHQHHRVGVLPVSGTRPSTPVGASLVLPPRDTSSSSSFHQLNTKQLVQIHLNMSNPSSRKHDATCF